MSDFLKKKVYDEAAIWYFFCFAIAVRPILQYVLAPLTGWRPRAAALVAGPLNRRCLQFSFRKT